MTGKRFVRVLGRQMAYVEQGSGDPILLLHGNPTSSYLWRNIIPHLADGGRCIAPDLLGMGDSDKLPSAGPGAYRFADHREQMDALVDELGINEKVTLVVHDWGSALGFDWARRHPEAVAKIAYMEAIVEPLAWDDFSDAVGAIFRALRGPAGEELVLQKNLFVEKILPGAIQRTLTEEEMDEYRRPFVEPGEDRRPTLTWPREIPIDGEPADVHEVVAAYSGWLAQAKLPKLFVNAKPGAILTGRHRDFCRTWPNQVEVTVQGSHFVQEDSPDEIGRAIRDWMHRRSPAC